MAKVTFGSTKGFSLKDVKQGETKAGYIVSLKKETGKFGDQFVMYWKDDADSPEYPVYAPAGTAKNFVNNMAMGLGMQPMDERFKAVAEKAKGAIGCLARFTRGEDIINTKSQKPNAIFEIEYDDAETLDALP